MSAKKIETILNLIEIANNNLKTAQKLVLELQDGKPAPSANSSAAPSRSWQESKALEVEEGYFDGENMIGDNSRTYPVPQNYASKTQLVIGDRMKWIQTPDRDVFKLIDPADRERVTGTFTIEGGNYVVLVDSLTQPVKILKASATYAMKNLGLEVGDEVALMIPTSATPTWGAFVSVVKGTEEEQSHVQTKTQTSVEELNNLDEFTVDDKTDEDYF